MIRRMTIIVLTAMFITGCAATKKSDMNTPPTQSKILSPATRSELEQGKRLFKDGYYKRAMQQLLPLAAEGNMEAQYAVGYMYYYGFGTTQDTESGAFWIQRSANQGFQPAAQALIVMHQEQMKNVKKTRR